MSTDEVYVHRNSASGQIIHPIGSTATLVDADQLSFGDVRSGDHQIGGGYGPIGVEWRTLGTFNWTSKGFDLPNAGNLQLGPIANFGAIDLNGTAQSSFSSREFNFRVRVFPWLTVFAGKRTINIYDQTNFNVIFPAFSIAYPFDIPWTASGHQIGAELRLFGPGTPWEPGPFFGDVDIRAGSYSVSAVTNSDVVPSIGGSFPGGSSYSQTGVKMYEYGGALGYRLGYNLEFRVGYRYMSIPDALFASDYAAASTAQGSQNIVPNPRALNIQMVTAGMRFMLGGPEYCASLCALPH